MSKQTIWIIAIGLVVALVEGYFALSKQNASPGYNVQDFAILLYVREGDVSYKTPEHGSFQKATSSPIAITNNTLVYTGLGRASILFPNNSTVELDEYTELKVTYEDNKTTLYQTLGTTYHRVEALITGATYEVETPGTLAAVRGTKFAVKYDKITKATKIAVTEHKVQVSKITVDDTATTTRKVLETLLLEEGKTARIDVQATTTVAGTTTRSISIVETKDDVDMKIWVDENKGRDIQEETIKERETSKEEIREEIKQLLRNDAKPEVNTTETREESSETTTEIKTETRTNTTTKTPVLEESKPTVTQETETATQTQTEPKPLETLVVRKISEEVFFDKFNTLFVNLFYVDDANTPCQSSLTGSGRVRAVTAYAAESGYPFTSTTLLSFATAIDAYCLRKDLATQAKLQARFDVEFPFNE